MPPVFGSRLALASRQRFLQAWDVFGAGGDGAARRRRMKKSAYLRALVREQPLETAADWLKWAERHEGRQWLREK